MLDVTQHHTITMAYGTYLRTSNQLLNPPLSLFLSTPLLPFFASQFFARNFAHVGKKEEEKKTANQWWEKRIRCIFLGT